MKKTAAKVLAAVLGVVMLVGMIPAATAARQEDLRKVVVNQTKALAEFRWKTPKRIARLEFPEAKKQAMHEGGVLPTTYFEYDRTYLPYKGVIAENNVGNFEEIKASLVDGAVMKNENGDHLGLDVNAFLVDVVSRVSPVRFSTVKEALTSGALTALLPAADVAAASSAAAISGISETDLKGAYGRLQEGDLLIAYDDNAPMGEAPKISVLVVTYLDGQNTGEVTVTYPAFMQPLYTFTCKACGGKTTEGPTSAFPSKHVRSTASYTFKAFARHNEVDTNSSCDGELSPNQGNTWYTQTYTFDQLKEGFAGGGAAYLLYTIAAYADGSVPAASVTVTTDATSDNLAGGFQANITSDYRIVQVDAVLSQPGKADRVFTNYPEYADWSHDFANAELDKALFGSTSGSYTLALNVHTGPVTEIRADRPTTTHYYEFTIDDQAPAAPVKLGMPAAVSAGQTVTVTVDASTAFDAADEEVKFDTNALTYKSGSVTPKCAASDVSADKGIVRVMAVGAKGAAGQIARLTFEAKKDVNTADIFEIKSASVSDAATANTANANKAVERDEVHSSINFGDVNKNDWFRDAVDYALDNGIMSGYNATTFGPNDKLSRAMVVQVLYNHEGKPATDAEGQLVRNDKLHPHVHKGVKETADYAAPIIHTALALFEQTVSTEMDGLHFAQKTIEPKSAPEGSGGYNPDYPEVRPLIISTIAFCGLALVGIPGEPYYELGVHIRGYSKFPVTCVLCQANGSHGYFPMMADYGHPGDSYEPRVSHVIPGTTEQMAVIAEEMLRGF